MGEWPNDPAWLAEIEATSDGDYGDRRQEIVCIGQHMDAKAVTAVLDACLLTDSEMAAGPKAWRKYEDPFGSWDEAE